jgi:hypothetical protein
LGTGALAQGGASKYPIKQININNLGNYSQPTLDFGNHTVTWEYFEISVSNSGVYLGGSFSTNTNLGSFVPSLVGGHGTGATVALYLYDENNGTYYYQVYTEEMGSGYAPNVVLSSSTGTSFRADSYIDENNELKIYYSDNNKTNLYAAPPTVSISFGGATAQAVLDGTPANGQNTAIGYQALYSNSAGRENTALGHQSLYASTGNSNLGLGHLAGNTLTTGNNNIFIGKNAGKGITTGSGNLILGNTNYTFNNSLGNSVVIADGSGNTKIFSGSSGGVKIGYGNDFTDDYNYKLKVNGRSYFSSPLIADYLSTARGLRWNDGKLGNPDKPMFIMYIPFSNKLQLRTINDANDTYITAYETDRLTHQTRFFFPVQGVNAVNNDEFVTLGQLSSGQTIGANISGSAASANVSNFLANNSINDLDLTSPTIIGPGQFRTMNGANVTGAPDQGYWNIMSMRHWNPVNDYRTEIAGSFFNPNDIRFRNTNNNASQGWNVFFHSGNVDYAKTALGIAEGTALNNDVNGSAFRWGGIPNSFSTPNSDGIDYLIGQHSNTYAYRFNETAVKNWLGIPLTGGFDLQGATDRGSITNRLVYFTGESAVSVPSSGIALNIRKSWIDVYNHTTSTGESLILNPSGGNVGIGTTTPREKLSVNGKIRAREVKVEPINNWPDYVFDEGYKPLSLYEIETFIKKHKHLPEVPSAKEVGENGLELGEMNRLLLKKVEELTLHLIEKEKELKETNSRVDDLARIVKELSEKIIK